MPKIENEYLRNDLLELSVANIYMYEKKTGLELYSGTLKSHELSDKAGDPTIVRGGQLNDPIYSIPKNHDIQLKITDVVNRQDIDALKWSENGIQDVGTNVVYAMHMPRNYTILKETDPSTVIYVELSREPLAGEEVAIYNNKTNAMIVSANIEQDATDKKKFVITGETLSAGDTVFVSGFKFLVTDATAQYVDIKSETNSPDLFTVIEIPLYNTSNEIVKYKQYIFPKTKLSTSGSSKGESEKKENDSESTLLVLKDTNLDYLGRIVYINA